jgi:hypothetical protein
MSRTDLDLLIDIAWHEVMVAPDAETRLHRELQWRALANQRNALRAPAEIEQLERERGLR